MNKQRGLIYDTYKKQDNTDGKILKGYGSEYFNVKEIPRDRANKIIVENHYSEKYVQNSYVHLGVYIEDELLGVLQFGYAMNPASMASIVTGTKIDEYLELNRMWLDDKAERNSESRAISYSMKFIRNKYPKIKWVQSFADERCGLWGIVYQASNFIYCGSHFNKFHTIEGETYHNSRATNSNDQKNSWIKEQIESGNSETSYLRQFRYLYFLQKKEMKNLVLKQYSYPKYYEDE